MVGIIILNYNNAGLTIQCLETVRAVNTYPCKYIVVDNASTDGSLDALRNGLLSIFGDDYSYVDPDERPDSLPMCTLTHTTVNGGYAQGNNFGLRLAEKDGEIDYILILNNDIVFTEDIIPSLVSFLKTHDEAGIVSPLLLKKNGIDIDFNCARKDCKLKEIALYYLLYCRDFKGIISKLVDERKILANDPSLLNAESVQIELPSGSCMLIDKDLFRQIGYFDPNTFLYYEEGILYRKLLEYGKVNYVLPGLRCIHLGAQTTSTANRSYSYLKNSNKSAYYYVMHYRDLKLLQKVAFSVLYAFYSTVLYVKQHLKFT